MSKTAVFVLYVKGEEMMNKCTLDFNALDSMIGEKLYLPVKNGKNVIGHVINLSKRGDKIYAKVEFIADIAYSIQQLSKKTKKDEVVVTEAKLWEVYI